MDAADSLLDKIFTMVNLLPECARKVNKLASDLEQNNKTINVSKVVGSSVTAAGAVTLLTGGLGIPVLAAAGAVATGVGLATTVGSEVVRNALSSSAMSEAKHISHKIEEARNGIQTVMISLTGEQRRNSREESCDGNGHIPADIYVIEQILRAMAKCKGLKGDKINLTAAVSGLSLKKIVGTDLDFLRPLKIPTLEQLVNVAIMEKEQKIKLIGQVDTFIRLKALRETLGHVSTGVVGLLLAVTELINNIQNLKKCETDASERLREMAETLQKAHGNLKRELDEIETPCQTLADKKCNRKKIRSSVRCSIL